MKKFYISLVFLLSLNQVFSQLHVASNSFVYNKGAMVYVTGNVNLNTLTSNIYLRNEGQLLQGATALSTNTGIGDLSVFQEGTSNNFGYNYWCAPVGVPAAAAGNNSFGINQIKRPSGLTSFGGESTITSSNGLSTNSSLVISSKWIYKYINANSYSSWSHVGVANTLLPGEGFTMKGVSGSDSTPVGELTNNNPGNNQRYDFRGKPNDGNIDIVVGNALGLNNSSRTLTGNPYPSSINLNLFLLENSGYNINYSTGAVSAGGPTNVINGIAYYWEHQKPALSHVTSQYVGGYGYYVPNNVNAFSPGTYNNATWNTYNADGSPNTVGGAAGTERYKRMFCPVGQGFLVQGSVATGNAVMRNRYRTFVKESVANNSQFERIADGSQINNPQLNNWDEILNVAGVDYTQFSKNQVPQIKLHITYNNLFTRENTLAFNPNTTDNFDNAMDAKLNPADVDTYFPLFENGSLVISTLPFDIDKRIPFAFKANAETNFKVRVGQEINFTGSDEVYLYDKVTEIYHDIKNDFFELTLASGMIENRYEITFRNGALGDNDSIKENLAVVQNNTTQLLSISNPNSIDLKSATVFDITGKLIFNKPNLGNKTSHEFSTSTLSEGVYLVRLETTNNETSSYKIIVTRSN